MKRIFTVAAFSLGLTLQAAAQVQPAATGPGLPIPAGNLDYSIRFAHTMEFSENQGNWQSSALSGDVNYSNGNQRHPFSLGYGGGYSWSISGPSYGSGLFQHLLISQGLSGHRWSANITDNVSYSPQAPTFGFSGIPGIGEPIAGQDPIPAAYDQSILTLKTNVVNNTATGAVTRNLSSSAILNLGGNYSILRFPDGNGFDTDTKAANGGLQWRMDARNSLTSDYQYSQFTYGNSDFSFQSQSGLFGFMRQWTRRITSNVSVGPAWTSSSRSSTVPTSTIVGSNALVAYRSEFSSVSLAYSRGVNGGAGYLIGAQVDTASANYSRTFDKQLTVGVLGSYSRTAGLINNGITTGKYGGVQATRRLGKYLTVFANYSALAQSSSSPLPSNTLGQLVQIVGFGFGYSPRPVSLRTR